MIERLLSIVIEINVGLRSISLARTNDNADQLYTGLVTALDRNSIPGYLS